MNNKLEQQLRRAGFPQHSQQFLSYSPSLSELIEACDKEIDGPNLNTKERNPVEHLLRFGWNGEEWFACYEFYDSHILDKYDFPLIEFADTLEESVANLWLKLNE